MMSFALQQTRVILFLTSAQRKSLVPQFVAQLVPQLSHVASCSWWKGDGGSMWGHPFTNHNSPHGQVVAL